MALARQGRVAVLWGFDDTLPVGALEPGLVDRVGLAETSHVIGIPTTWQ
jgi:hypothetical protein